MSDVYRLFLPLGIIRHTITTYIGFILFSISIIMGWIISGQLKDSWRVGVPREQKTPLVRTGLYAFVRNPYFLTYYVMFLAMFLIRPSLALLLCTGLTGLIFHGMVLSEEKHLSEIHGRDYEVYRLQTGRYWPKLSS